MIEQKIPQFEPYVPQTLVLEYVSKAIRDGYYGPGKIVEQFEFLLKKFSGAKHAIVTTSGTMALYVSLKAFGISGKKNLVVCPSYSHIAGAEAAKMLDTHVMFAPIKKDTLCIDPDILQKIIEQQKLRCLPVTAVVFINHNGYIGKDVKRIKDICQAHRITLIEDSCQAFGMPHAGRTGDVGIYSFSVPKIVTTGQGGCIITDNDNIATICRQLIDHGAGDWRKDRIFKAIGLNLRMTDIQAAMGVAMMNKVHELIGARNNMFDMYRNEGLDFFNPDPDNLSSTWMVMYRSRWDVSSRNLQKFLASRNIGSEIYYRNNAHAEHIPTLNYLNSNDYANSIEYEMIYLPSSLTLTHKDVKRIVQTIREWEK